MRDFASTPETSGLERAIEQHYLEEKLAKVREYQVRRFSALFAFWSTKNAARRLGLRNFHMKDLQLFDEEFAPLFEPLESRETREAKRGLLRKAQLSLPERVFWSVFEKNKERPPETLREESFEEALVETLYSRTQRFVKGLEFLHRLQIPPDFYVETALFGFHVWVLVRRLRVLAEEAPEQGRFAEVAAKLRALHVQILKEFRRDLSLGRNPEHYLDVLQLFEDLERLLDYHFVTAYPSDAGEKLKPLVFQTLLLSRGSPSDAGIDALSEYVLCTWRASQRLEAACLLAGFTHFNALNVGFDLARWEEQSLGVGAYEQGEEAWVGEALRRQVLLTSGHTCRAG